MEISIFHVCSRIDSLRENRLVHQKADKIYEELRIVCQKKMIRDQLVSTKAHTAALISMKKTLLAIRSQKGDLRKLKSLFGLQLPDSTEIMTHVNSLSQTRLALSKL